MTETHSSKFAAAATEQPAVKILDDGSVCEIRLNRPEKRNALNDAMFAGLIRAVDGLATRTNVRAVVLSAEPPAFCAGLDLAAFKAFVDESERGERPFGDPGTPGSGRRNPGNGQRVVLGLRRLPVPVIAAVEGPAIGGGFQLTLGADIRVLGPNAVMAAREINYGITLDMGGTQLLPLLIGEDRAMELMLTGRDVCAAEAYTLGLATSLADDARSAALDLAHQIAGRNPDAVTASKALVTSARDWGLSEGFAAELEVMAGNIGRPNQVEAVRSHFGRRTPQFSDRS